MSMTKFTNYGPGIGPNTWKGNHIQDVTIKQYDPLKPIFEFEARVYVLNKTVDLLCYLWTTFKQGEEWFIDDDRVFMKAEVYSMVLLKFSK